MGSQMEEAMKRAGVAPRELGEKIADAAAREIRGRLLTEAYNNTMLRNDLDEAEKLAMFWREKYTVARRQCRQLVAAALCAIGAGFTLGYMLAEAFCGP